MCNNLANLIIILYLHLLPLHREVDISWAEVPIWKGSADCSIWEQEGDQTKKTGDDYRPLEARVAAEMETFLPTSWLSDSIAVSQSR